MSNANDLLRRALNYLEYNQDVQLKIDIRNYLATEKEAEPVNEEIGKALIEMHTNYVATPKVVYQIELNEKAMNVDLVAALRFSISKYFDDAYVYGDELLAEVLEDIKNHQPKPEPPRKPMTPKERSELYIELEETIGPDAHLLSFLSGIAAAERYHGILGGSDE